MSKAPTPPKKSEENQRRTDLMRKDIFLRQHSSRYCNAVQKAGLPSSLDIDICEETLWLVGELSRDGSLAPQMVASHLAAIRERHAQRMPSLRMDIAVAAWLLERIAAGGEDVRLRHAELINAILYHYGSTAECEALARQMEGIEADDIPIDFHLVGTDPISSLASRVVEATECWQALLASHASARQELWEELCTNETLTKSIAKPTPHTSPTELNMCLVLQVANKFCEALKGKSTSVKPPTMTALNNAIKDLKIGGKNICGSPQNYSGKNDQLNADGWKTVTKTIQKVLK